MSFMFADCKNLTELKINDNWNISLVENMSYMFKNCEKLTELKVDRWITSKVNNLKGVFQ
jgi:surface protein